jgi:hypothetical protein
MKMTMNNSNKSMICFSLLVLAVGCLFYAAFRPADSVYFLPQAFSLYNNYIGSLGRIGNSLPSFIHVLAFSLLTASIVKRSQKNILQVCIFWVLVNLVFEAGQHSAISLNIVQQLPVWFEHIPVLENSANYFIHGRFDIWDLFAAFLGGLIAYIGLLIAIK